MRKKCFLSEIVIPINRHVINVDVSFSYSCDCGSIQFLVASFERPTCIAIETSTHPDMFPCQLLQIPDPMTWSLGRCEIISLENLTRVSGCQEGSMLSSTIAAETHVEVQSDQIKYSPNAFENLYQIISDIETRYMYTYIYCFNIWYDLI